MDRLNTFTWCCLTKHMQALELCSLTVSGFFPLNQCAYLQFSLARSPLCNSCHEVSRRSSAPTHQRQQTWSLPTHHPIWLDHQESRLGPQYRTPVDSDCLAPFLLPLPNHSQLSHSMMKGAGEVQVSDSSFCCCFSEICTLFFNNLFYFSIIIDL